MAKEQLNSLKIALDKVHKCRLKIPGVTVDVCYVTSDILGQDRFRHTGHDHHKIELTRCRLLNIKSAAPNAHDVPPWNSEILEGA